MERANWRFVVIWEFQIRQGAELEFEATYGPDGDWVRLFRRDDAFVGTELVRDLQSRRKYLTLDFWTSQQAYEKFRERNAAEYKAIDARCEGLTEAEREVGRFEKC